MAENNSRTGKYKDAENSPTRLYKGILLFLQDEVWPFLEIPRRERKKKQDLSEN